MESAGSRPDGKAGLPLRAGGAHAPRGLGARILSTLIAVVVAAPLAASVGLAQDVGAVVGSPPGTDRHGPGAATMDPRLLLPRARADGRFARWLPGERARDRSLSIRSLPIRSPTHTPGSPSAVAGQEPEPDRPSTPLLIAGGLLGGGIGVLGGGYLGAAIADDTCQGEGCLAGIIQGAFIGAVAAESVLLPLGVHVAAGGEGDFGTSVLASAGLGAAAVGLAYGTELQGPGAAIVLTIPFAQLGISIAEHR